MTDLAARRRSSLRFLVVMTIVATGGWAAVIAGCCVGWWVLLKYTFMGRGLASQFGEAIGNHQILDTPPG